MSSASQISNEVSLSCHLYVIRTSSARDFSSQTISSQRADSSAKNQIFIVGIEFVMRNIRFPVMMNDSIGQESLCKFPGIRHKSILIKSIKICENSSVKFSLSYYQMVESFVHPKDKTRQKDKIYSLLSWLFGNDFPL